MTEFMRKYGMPERINEEVFIAMAKALDFIDPGKTHIEAKSNPLIYLESSMIQATSKILNTHLIEHPQTNFQ